MSKVSPKRLGDLITLKRGYDLPEKNRVSGPYPVISSAGVSGFHNEYKVEGQGVVTGRYGTLGEMYFVEDKYWPHNTALYVQNFKGNDPKYIYYLLSCLGRIRTSDKSAVPGVNRNELHEMAIPAIDDRKLQVAIRKVLEAIDNKIELNNRINAELEAMAKTLYDYWFVQFDFPDDSPKGQGKPYKTSGGKMVYNPTLKREIPEGWEVAPIAKYFNYQEGPGITKEKYANEGHNFINIKCIQDNDLDVSNASKIADKFVDAYSHFQLDENDIVLSTSGTLGRLAIVRKVHLPLLLNTSVIRFKAREFYYFEYLYCYLQSQTFIGYLNQLATGSIQKNFGPTHLAQIFETFPSENLIIEFSKLTGPILKKIISLRSETDELIKLRDWLLPILMNGQVTVK
ncbi:MAG: restriction endonuclease subunit S [Marinomonas sp.]|nr:MAG: restriction endonuclease subunit S [Marinomonas sp.]